jgi:hypothetical protein
VGSTENSLLSQSSLKMKRVILFIFVSAGILYGGFSVAIRGQGERKVKIPQGHYPSQTSPSPSFPLLQVCIVRLCSSFSLRHSKPDFKIEPRDQVSLSSSSTHFKFYFSQSCAVIRPFFLPLEDVTLNQSVDSRICSTHPI